MSQPARIDPTFVHEVMAEPGGEHLLTCWSCGTCAATCLVRRYEPDFNPRLILRRAGLGLREQVLASREIWQCSACDACYPRCPREIHISEVMKAIRNIAIREGYTRPDVTACVDVQSCIACGLCVAACPYEAISLQSVACNGAVKQAAQVDKNLCMACGICNSVCLSSSISVEGFSDESLHASFAPAVDSAPAEGNATRALVIVCNWCMHAEADLDYAAHPPPGVTVVHVPCSGRVTPLFITTALQRGFDGVLIVGCKEDECHYKHGNTLEAGRLPLVMNLLDLLGIERERAQFARLGALERARFPELVEKLIHDVQTIGAFALVEKGG
jgi:coenzyme F420-reducing hydrogenase delta subunit/heterodisulfide reductase subunit C